MLDEAGRIDEVLTLAATVEDGVSLPASVPRAQQGMLTLASTFHSTSTVAFRHYPRMEYDAELPNEKQHDWLRRLPAGFYRGLSAVHWQMTIEGRVTGWLKPGFHARFREVLLHTMARFDLVCPIYCLMPDHLHLLWMGVAETSDQKKAAKFFREHGSALLERSLKGTRFQKQGYDHVLRQHEKGADAVREMAWYIQQNPVRAELVQETSDWPYLGCMVPGYPTLHPLGDGYWDKFWKVRAAMVERGRGA